MDSSTTTSSSSSLAPSPSFALPTTEPHRVLLLLDCQAGMLAPPPIGVPNAQSVRHNIEEVLEEARRARPMPLIVHMRNNGDVGEPDEPGTGGWELVFRPKDDSGGELIIDKRKNNAFRGTPLGDLVPPTAEMVIVGFQTDHSIRATCQEGVKRGNEVLLIRGAHATHDRIEVLYGGGTTPASRIEGEVESELEDLGVHILDMKDLPGIFMDR
ncbi:Isochorismatase-like protein [Panaeolus papilionaceus]|nr:Isochorismatase-like protein [Panaeolus papilionaceus]